MVKYIALIKRKKGLSREEFVRYWKEVHAPLACKLVPGLRKYVQNYVTEENKLRIDVKNREL